jgi:glycosyltransferase involved in cell wall biosynthesis
MKIVSTSYSNTAEFNEPLAWLKRISFYTGLLEELAKQHEVMSIERISHEGELVQNNVLYYFMKLKNTVVHFPFRMHRLIKKYKPDVVLVNGLIFPLQVIQLRLTLGKQVKILLLHRAEKPAPGYKKFLQKIAGRCVDAYLFTSVELAKEWISKEIIESKKVYEVIQASSSFRQQDKFAARTALSLSGIPLFLWVGRLDANKDPLTVVKAFIQFLRVQPEAMLYIIYQEAILLKAVMDLIKSDPKASDAIKLVGKADHRQLEQWYSAADFIISGSHYEGSGIAVSEAMSCGCIPVVTDIASFRKMTGNGKAGLLYEAGNEKELLTTLLKTKEIDRESESKKVLAQFQEELSFAAIAQKINKITGFTGLPE